MPDFALQTFILVAAFVASALLGSLVAGILYSQLRGADIRQNDLPGGSGVFRQFGLVAAVLATLFDILKGAAAVYLVSWLTGDAAYSWLAMLGVVLGHCYPAFFGWRGGGGIAPFLGALLVAAPLTCLYVLLFAAAVMLLYKKFWQTRVGLNVIPFATIVVVPVGVGFALHAGGLADLVAGGLAMALRAFHMTRQTPDVPDQTPDAHDKSKS